MTPAIATAAPHEAKESRPPAPGPAATEDDAFRSALAALFAMVGAATPAQDARSIVAQGRAGSVEGTAPFLSGADGDDEPGSVAGESEPAQDAGFELAANPEPASLMPPATVTQVLGLAQAAGFRIELPKAGDADREQPVASMAQLVPAPDLEAVFRGDADRTAAERAAAQQSAAGPETADAAPGEVAFEAVITDASANNKRRTINPDTPDQARAASASERRDAAPARPNPVQPESQTRDRDRDGSQRIALDADSRQTRKRQPEASGSARHVVAPGFGLKNAAAGLERRGSVPHGATPERMAAMERAVESRMEPVAVRHLRLQVVPDPTRPVEVLVAERAGAVHVSVRAGDAATSSLLRGDLEGLVADLGRSGLRAETFAPAQAVGQESLRAVDAAVFARSEPEFGERQRQWQQQDSRQGNRKRRGDDEEAAFSLDYTLEKAQ